jgi:hypothetical protein
VTVRACSSASVNLGVGGSWVISVEVRDVYDCLTADTPVVTVTLPGGSTATPTVTTLTTGIYRAEYLPAVAGRFVARAVTTSHGAVDFSAYVTAAVTDAQMPDLTAVKNYIGPTSHDDSDLQDALDAEASAQRDVCFIPAAYPASLRQALLRRVTRNLAMRPLALGVQRGDAEVGEAALIPPGSDPEVRRLEKPFLMLLGA